MTRSKENDEKGGQTARMTRRKENQAHEEEEGGSIKSKEEGRK